MRIAHLIMAYKDPSQIERLIKRLGHKNFDFFIHLDKKIEIKSFEYLSKIDKVFFVDKRSRINWGGYSFTTSIISCTKEILATGKYDFINLLSGQDYPIKTNEEIYNFFEKNIGRSFISFDDSGSAWWKTAIRRIEKYHLTDLNFRGRHGFEYLINLLLPKRKFPLPYAMYGSECASWWTMNSECADYVVSFAENNPRLKKFMFFTWAADEFLIPTIVMNSPFKNTVVNNNCRYIDWSSGGTHPKILTKQDYDQLSKSTLLFARKFDIKKDSLILDMLDKINTKSPVV